MKKQIKDLELWEIDFLVAKAEGLDAFILKNVVWVREKGKYDIVYEPTTNPAQAWPIIERERIDIFSTEDDLMWMAELGNDTNLYTYSYGKTSLEAAMRCYVQSKYGDEVEL